MKKKLLLIFIFFLGIFTLSLFKNVSTTLGGPCSGAPCYDAGTSCGTQCCNCDVYLGERCCFNGCKTTACCSAVNGNWGACSATTLLKTCSTKNSCGTQVCTPAGGTQSCCLATGITVTFSADYPGAAANVSPFGPANGTLNITGGTTTVNGATLDFGTLNVTTGYISVLGTGVAKTSAACD